MKHLLILFVVTLGLAGSLSAQTSANSPKVLHPVATSAAKRARLNALIERAKRGEIALEFISNEAPVGSHVPQVMVYYKGHVYAANNFSPGNSYDGRALSASGALDVGSALSSLDPAITRY